MILNKAISAMLSAALMLGTLSPVYAQNNIANWPGIDNNVMQKQSGKMDNALNNMLLNQKPDNSDDFLNPYRGLNYFQAFNAFKKANPNGNIGVFHNDYFIAPAWRAYNNAIKDYNTSHYAKLTPYEMMDAMSQQTRDIAKLLQNNPRYIKEARIMKVKEYGSSCLQGIVLGLLAVAAVYTAGASLGAEGALVSSWFGASAGTMALTAGSVSLAKGIAAVVMLEIVTYLGSEIVNNLYEDLTERLVKYNYVENNVHAQNLIDSAAKGSIENESMVEAPLVCENPQAPKVTRSTRWVDNIAREEAIVRLHGLIVIKNELKYGTDRTKYDMALLDIINLFSERTQVKFDEKVFTKTIIEKGEKHYEKNADTVDVGTGRLIRRTPELKKALIAIQDM